MKQEKYYFHFFKTLKHLLIKLIRGRKKKQNLSLPDQEKHFRSNHQPQLKDLG